MYAALIHRMTATLFVQPLDLVKNRMQMSGESHAQSIIDIRR